MNLLFIILSFIYGCIVGSFLNVVILRLPEGESLNGRSHCTHCGHRLKALDLVPIASFIFLGGKCRYCGRKISPRYALVEVVSGLLFVAAWLALGPSAPAALLIKAAVFVSACLAIFIIDLEHYIILDSVILWAGAIMLVMNVILDITAHPALLSLSSAAVSGILGALAGSAPLFLIWLFSKGRWMGFGDVKLLLFLGLGVEFPLILVLLLLAFLLGGLVSVPLLLFGRKNLGSKVPFGTFLTVAAVACLFWGQAILHWYLALLGF